jgi:hypothetical protein
MSNNLPANFIEAEAVATIMNWIDRVADMLTSEASRLTMRAFIRERVRAGTIPTMQVIQAARAGHQDADMALREYAAELLDRGELPPTALRAYVQEALVHPPANYPPGRNIVDTWKRDIGINIMVQKTMEHWHLPKTRSHATKNSKRLSACYLVSLALGRRGFNLTERGVEKIVDGVAKLTGRLSASMPPI